MKPLRKTSKRLGGKSLAMLGHAGCCDACIYSVNDAKSSTSTSLSPLFPVHSALPAKNGKPEGASIRRSCRHSLRMTMHYSESLHKLSTDVETPVHKTH